MCPRERFTSYKSLSRLVLCYKKDWATLLHLIYFCYLLLVTNYLITKLSVTYNFSACREYLFFDLVAENTLLKTAYHFLLLLVGFDTLTYRKELQLIPYTCGSSRLFSGAVAGEWSAFSKWNLVRKHLYSVLKFIVTCYYGKQSFEGIVRGIFTSSGTTISKPSTYCTNWKYWILNSFGYDRITAS